MLNLFVVRHGETEYNLIKRLQGQLDIPLSDFGKEGAYELGGQLKKAGYHFDTFLSSPLKRAYDTCLILKDSLGYPDKKVVICPDFIERAFGTWEGKTINNLHQMMALPSFSQVPGYEKNEDLLKRIQKGLEDLVAKYDGQNVLLVTHSNALKAILICCNPQKYNFETKTANLDVVYIRLFKDKRPEVISLNLFNNQKEDKTA